MKQEENRWKPKRNGDIYCSPACGAGCTHEKYLSAVKKAKALAKKCHKQIGGKWEIRVHENLGWHYEVALSGANIQIDYGGYLGQMGDYYTCGFTGGTPSVVSLHPKTFKSPKQAFDAQMKAVKIEAQKWNDYLSSVSAALKK